jgi:predicted nucleic acid-binding protein
VGIAYLDTSCLVAIALGEPEASATARALERFDELCSSNLLEAELMAALAREKLAPEPALLGGITWVVPDRPLSAEISRVLAAGYLRGADAWHLASALFVADQVGSIPFLTLDRRQEAAARKLGLVTG